jgi:hypothetical protein
VTGDSEPIHDSVEESTPALVDIETESAVVIDTETEIAAELADIAIDGDVVTLETAQVEVPSNGMAPSQVSSHVEVSHCSFTNSLAQALWHLQHKWLLDCDKTNMVTGPRH